MKSRLIKNLDLSLRIVGGDIIIFIIGIIELMFRNINGIFVIRISLLFILIVTGNIIKRNLSVESETSQIGIIYAVCRGLINIFIIENISQLNLSVLVIMIEALWIKMFYLPKRENM